MSIEVTASNPTIVIGKQTYHWVGEFGCIIKSYENGLKEGDIRVIGNVIFYVFMISKNYFSKDEIAWTTIDTTIEFINEFKKRLFGI